jgi:hypothetical protein
MKIKRQRSHDSAGGLIHVAKGGRGRSPSVALAQAASQRPPTSGLAEAAAPIEGKAPVEPDDAALH